MCEGEGHEPCQRQNRDVQMGVKNSRGVRACNLGSSMDTGKGLEMSWDWVKVTQVCERLGFCAKWLCRAVYGLIDGDKV